MGHVIDSQALGGAPIKGEWPAGPEESFVVTSPTFAVDGDLNAKSDATDSTDASDDRVDDSCEIPAKDSTGKYSSGTPLRELLANDPGNDPEAQGGTSSLEVGTLCESASEQTQRVEVTTEDTQEGEYIAQETEPATEVNTTPDSLGLAAPGGRKAMNLAIKKGFSSWAIDRLQSSPPHDSRSPGHMAIGRTSHVGSAQPKVFYLAGYSDHVVSWEAPPGSAERLILEVDPISGVLSTTLRSAIDAALDPRHVISYERIEDGEPGAEYVKLRLILHSPEGPEVVLAFGSARGKTGRLLAREFWLWVSLHAS